MTANQMTPKKILMTADAVGGVWTYALELARTLSACGVSTSLAVMGGAPDAAKMREASNVKGLKVYKSGYKLEWMEDPWEDVESAGGWLLGLEEEIRPDIVHLNGYAHGSLPFKAPKLMVGHSCVVSWWEAVKGIDLPSAWDRYRREAAKGLSSAGLVAAPTKSMLESLYKNYRIKSPGTVIPNGRDPEAFRPGKKEEFVFTAGRLWDEAKNAATVFRVAPYLKWPVYAAGPVKHPNVESAFDGRINALGRLSTRGMASWLSRAAIYAHPAYYEPFGLTVLEAALSGCALVLGDIPALRELWDGAAEFVEPDDEDSLASVLGFLIRNPAARGELSRKALERSRSFTAERMAAGYMDAYTLLASGNAGKKATEDFACGF